MKRLLPHDTDLGWTPYAWLIYSVPFTLTPLWSPRQATPSGWTMYAAATLLFLVLYFRGYWVRGADIKAPEYAPTQADEFLLLALRENDGRLLVQSSVVRVGLAGAFLADLSLTGRITLAGDHITVGDEDVMVAYLLEVTHTRV